MAERGFFCWKKKKAKLHLVHSPISRSNNNSPLGVDCNYFILQDWHDEALCFFGTLYLHGSPTVDMGTLIMSAGQPSTFYYSTWNWSKVVKALPKALYLDLNVCRSCFYVIAVLVLCQVTEVLKLTLILMYLVYVTSCIILETFAFCIVVQMWTSAKKGRRRNKRHFLPNGKW